ncbi:serine hydrolase FSH [Peziza echinospora]|nr:serine hydrolase FSH [Peziza echinospora]
MNLLMLHGYGESGAQFSKQTLPLQKSLLAAYPGTKFHFPNGPNPATRTIPTYQNDDDNEYDNASSTSGSFTWLPDTLTRGLTRQPTDIERAGITKTWRYLADLLSTYGPFDGIISFSQGASVGVVLASVLEEHRRRLLPTEITNIMFPATGVPHHPEMKFVVSFSGFKAPETVPGTKEIYRPKVRTPVVHVLGRVDDHLGEGEMWELVQACEGGEDPEEGAEEAGRIVWWDGGHYVPGKKVTINKITSIIENIIP